MTSSTPGPEEVTARTGFSVPAPEPVAVLRDVEAVEGTTRVLGPLDLTIGRGRHTVVLGPNGSGKTTLLRLLSGYRHPTRGTVEVLGHRLGRVDVRLLRRRIGLVSVALDDLVWRGARVLDVVAAGAEAKTRPTQRYVGPQAEAAEGALATVGAAHLAGRRAATLSQGEWQRVRIARSLVAEPGLLLLDEPFAGLDLGARETLLADLAALCAQPSPTIVLVTHHVEEIGAGIVDAVLLAGGLVTAAGPLDDTLTSATLSACFGLSLEVEQRGGRWRATAAGRPGPGSLSGQTGQ